jgi:hypothetical protein
MSSVTQGPQALEDVPVPVKLKLAALWTATMFLFAYGDIYTVYRAEKVREILDGKIAGIEVNQAFLMAASVYVAIPSVMVFLSLVLRPRVSRWTNLAAGRGLRADDHRFGHRRGMGLLHLPERRGGRARLADRLVRVELAPPAGNDAVAGVSGALSIAASHAGER